jgi:transcription-repair coupling factor (superfamily II helicase)
MPDVQMRLVHYKRIASVADEEQLRNLQVELIDRFGLLPEATGNLFRQTRLRLRAALLGIHKIEAFPGGATIEFAAATRVDPALIVGLIQDTPAVYSLDSRQRLRVKASIEDYEERFIAMEALVGLLADDDSGDDLVVQSV